MGCLLALTPGLCPAAEDLSWRIEHGDVRVLVPVKPGGAFQARAHSLGGVLTLNALEPLSLTGELSLELATIDTGIALRNRHLIENYLEVSRGKDFKNAVLSKIVLAEANGTGFEGPTAFAGALLLHGVSRAIEGTAEIRRADSNLDVEATFSLSLTDFGIEPPQYMGVGVANKVLVNVTFTAKPAQVGER